MKKKEDPKTKQKNKKRKNQKKKKIKKRFFENCSLFFDANFFFCD